MSRPWTAEETALLRQMAAQDCTSVQISRALGRERDSVRQKVIRLGMPTLRAPSAIWTEERDTMLRELVRQPLTDDAIAACMEDDDWEPTGHAIHSRRQVLGIKRETDSIRLIHAAATRARSVAGGWTDERIEQLKALHAEGLSANEIAKRLCRGLTRNAVIGKLHRLGLTGGTEASRERLREARRLAAAQRKQRMERKVKAVSAPNKSTFNTRTGAPLPVEAPVVLREIAPVVDPKPFLERKRFECSWIVSPDGAEEILCCAGQVVKGGLCAAHAEIGLKPSKTTAKQYERAVSKWAA